MKRQAIAVNAARQIICIFGDNQVRHRARWARDPCAITVFTIQGSGATEGQV